MPERLEKIISPILCVGKLNGSIEEFERDMYLFYSFFQKADEEGIEKYDFSNFAIPIAEKYKMKITDVVTNMTRINDHIFYKLNIFQKK